MKIYMFPFELINRGSNIVIYGTGVVGEEYIRQLGGEYCTVLTFLNSTRDGFLIDGIPVKKPEKALLELEKADAIVIALSRTKDRDDARKTLKELGVKDSKIIDAIRTTYFTDRCEQDMMRDLPSIKLFPKSVKDRMFSMDGQDVLISMLFQLMGISRPSYIDLGTNDPIVGSNTAFFYKCGSRGVNVEANPNFIPKIKKARPEDVTINKGVASSSRSGQSLTFYLYSDSDESGSSCLNTFSTSRVEDNKTFFPEFAVQDAISVDMIGINEIIQEYCDGVWPDYLDIDVEGMDYEVLSDAVFKEGEGPKIIGTEISVRTKEEYDQMLKEKGYSEFCQIGPDTIYVRNDMMKFLN